MKFVCLVGREKGTFQRKFLRPHVFMARGGGDAKEIANILIILLEVVFMHHPPTVLCYRWTQNRDLQAGASSSLGDS